MLRSLLSSVVFGVAVSMSYAQQACNGYSELCSKSYGELTYVVTHNSYAFTANAASNQQCPPTTQLDDGVRGLKLSAVKPTNSSGSSDKIHLCHTSCNILDAGPAQDTLTNITSWLKSNPNEVITIMWNIPNQDFQASDFESVYKESGLLDLSYTQADGNMTWPTLQEMITSGKRVVNFVDVNSDQGSVPWLMGEFNYVFETPYDNNNESSFSCTIDRPSDPSNPSSMLYVMNHFLYGTINLGSTPIQIPQEGSASTTNSENSLMKEAKECSQTFGRAPNFLEVDFYNKGQTLQIAAELNNVTYNNKELACDKNASSSSSGGSDSSASHSALYMPLSTLCLVGLGMLLI